MLERTTIVFVQSFRVHRSESSGEGNLIFIVRPRSSHVTSRVPCNCSTLSWTRRVPNPDFPGGTTDGPSRSVQVRSTAFSSMTHNTDIVPSALDRAPYLPAF